MRIRPVLTCFVIFGYLNVGTPARARAASLDDITCPVGHTDEDALHLAGVVAEHQTGVLAARYALQIVAGLSEGAGASAAVLAPAQIEAAGATLRRHGVPVELARTLAAVFTTTSLQELCSLVQSPTGDALDQFVLLTEAATLRWAMQVDVRLPAPLEEQGRDAADPAAVARAAALVATWDLYHGDDSPSAAVRIAAQLQGEPLDRLVALTYSSIGEKLLQSRNRPEWEAFKERVINDNNALREDMFYSIQAIN